MRRVLLMVMTIAAFMSFGTTGAFAGPTSPAKPKCQHGKQNGKCKPPPKPPCQHGKQNGKCKPPPKPPCQHGKENGKCKPPPKPPCQHGEEKGKCKPPPVVMPPPKAGPCSKADLVLLEDLIEGTGALLCLYLGDNAPNADDEKDCPEALLALPLDNLIGACLFLPPAEVTEAAAATTATSSSPLAGLTDATAGTGITGGAGGMKGLLSMLTGLFKLA